ncbi:MAG: hypothetical protein WC508_02205 [Patescibacteria group bacterium]
MWFIRYWFFGLKKTVCTLVIASLIFSLLTPALVYPLEINYQKVNFKLAFNKIETEELVFSLLGALPAKATDESQVDYENMIGAPYKEEQAAAEAAAAMVVETNDKGTQEAIKGTTKQVATNDKQEEKRQSLRDKLASLLNKLKNAVFLALKQGLSQMMNTMAYDLATWFASGGEGQQPMFITQGWGDYLVTVADEAAGRFIETLGENWIDGLNLCNPNPRLKIGIGLGLAHRERPTKPKCTVTELVQNWGDFIKDPNFIDRFSPVFSPEGNDISIAFSAFGLYKTKKTNSLLAAIKQREEDKGLIGKVSKITGKILTPTVMIEGEARSLSELKDPEWEKVQYGDIALDAVATFANTLVGKLFDRLLKEGLAAMKGGSGSSGNNNFLSSLSSLTLPNFSGSDTTDQALYTGDSGTQLFVGQQAAQMRFLDLLQTGVFKQGPYDLLSKLTFCPDPANPGPDECVIKPDFRVALDKKLTIKQAIDQGLINGDAPFGFMDYDASSIYRGIPYRSIVILRAHRIVPVGWELAAQAISKYDKGKTYSLRTLMSEYDNPDSLYYRLVDPNWVLKSPDAFCKAQGFGPNIVFDDINPGIDANNNGSYSDSGDVPPRRLVGRAEYCADFQSCIKENDDGSCKYYGYCTEERRTWNLAGNSCPDYYNTCQSYQNSSGQAVSYLKNSLVYNGCGIDNAGCRWYCQQYNPINNIWTCTNEGKRILKPCTQTQKTCSVSLASCNQDSDCGANGGKCIAGCKLQASCSMASGQTVCSDLNAGIDLNVSETCSSGSKWWSQTDNKCVVTAGCVIPQRGVACSTTGCESLTNFLPNPSFETGVAPSPTGPVYLAEKWSTDAAGAVYFEKVSGASEKVFLGQNSLRFFTYNASGPITVSSDEFTLTANGSYTFSSQIHNRLNAGTITLKIIDSNSVTVSQKQSSVKYDWEQISFDFIAPANGKIKIQIVASGDLISGTAWFDAFSVTNSCVTNPITLNLIGTIDQDESKLHLDRNAQSCPAQAAGCSEFIRTKNNLGSNIVPNASFETWSSDIAQRGWQGDSISQLSNDANNTTNAIVGNSSLVISPLGSVQTDSLVAVAPATNYYVSFWAKAPNATDGVSVSNFVKLKWKQGTANKEADLTFYQDPDVNLNTNWRRFVSDATTTSAAGTSFALAFDNSTSETIYLDGVQMEAIGYQGDYSAYKDYGLVNLTYLKKPPASFGCSGDYQNDPGLCNNYALYCRADEVGCESYTPLDKSGPAVPGVAALDDYCPAECVGYNAYKQSTTFFESQESIEYFIPKTAAQCSASEEGCDEFTNLDKVSQGGEAKEYYQYLRLCKKPTEPGAICQNYYTWQGSGETGYQLKVYNLSAAAEGPQEVIPYNGPADTNWPDYWCDDKTMGQNNRPVCCDGQEDIASNPFCKQLYSADGKIYYRLYPNTITCSDSCLAYRKSRLGESEAAAMDNCSGTHGTWDPASTACVYQAIPQEGIACSAQAAGCRQYRGNAGGNVYTAYFNDLETGTSSGWRYGSIDTEALVVGGHSLKSHLIASDNRTIVETTSGHLNNGPCTDNIIKYQACDAANPNDYNCYDSSSGKCIAKDSQTTDTCKVEPLAEDCSLISSQMTEGKTYLISFWAKSDSATIISNAQVQMATTTGTTVKTTVIGTTNIKPEWNYYSFGPFVYTGGDYPAQLTAQLIITTPNGISTQFYVDNIRIQEINSYSYVIKGSWTTPASCDTNPFVSPAVAAPQFMLGCKQYTDFYKRVHNLKSFNHLCREQAAGCEALIDTYNYSSPFGQSFNVADPIAQVRIPSDQIIYMVNRPTYQCDAQYKGCQSLGQPAINNEDEISSYQTVYRVNNPDNYSSILCTSEQVGCDEFQTGNGFAYFKNPGSKTCEYKPIPNQNTYGWFKTNSTASTPDCPLVSPPLGVPHPGQTFAGTCSDEYSTCTQFIDPTTEYGKSIVSNGDLQRDIDDNKLPDDWNICQSAANPNAFCANYQSVSLRHDKLYTLTVIGTDAANDSDRLWYNTGQPFIEISNCPAITSFDHSMVRVCTDAGGSLVLNAGNLPTVCTANSDCPGGQICNGNVLVLPWAKDSRSADNTPNLPNSRQYSGRFFVPERDEICRLVVHTNLSFRIDQTGASNYINKYVKEIRLVPTDVSYVLSDSVDKLSCNAIVNHENGCVLFNDRSSVNYKIGEDDTSYLNFDANVSGPTINNGIAVNQCAGVCNSNVVLKVTPDRICNSWLYCSSYATFPGSGSQGERNDCTSIGLCDSLDDNGNCSDFIAPKKEGARQDYYRSLEEIRDLSGYVKAGLDFTQQLANAKIQTDLPKIIQGDYPYSEMVQKGGIVFSPGTNFENELSNSLKPFGWNLRYPLLTEPPAQSFSTAVWLLTYSKLIDSPIAAQKEGLDSSAPEGSKFLKLSGPYVVNSEEIDVFGSSEYIMSAFMNTKNLLKGSAIVAVEQFNDEGASLGINHVLNLGRSSDWVFRENSFRTNSATTRIKIILSNWGPTSRSGHNPWTGDTADVIHDVVGSSYFDDIKIKPNLQVGNNAYVPPSCRVYPAADSLSCDYVTSDNLRLRGWLGYCIETDPANPQQCLNWWPIELINGGFVDEQPFITQTPLYYCLKAKENFYGLQACLFRTDSTRCASVGAGATGAPSPRIFNWAVPTAWQLERWQIVKLRMITSTAGCQTEACGGAFTQVNFLPDPKGKDSTLFINGSKGWQAHLKFGTNNRLESIDFNIGGSNCICPDADITIEARKEWCQILVQTVTPFGQSRPWWSRISNNSGSTYTVPGLNYLYNFDIAPYGAVVPSLPVENPAAWNSSSYAGVGPLWVASPDRINFNTPFQARAGIPYSCDQTSAKYGSFNCAYPPQSTGIANKINNKSDQLVTAEVKGMDNLKRLFVRNYGSWQYQGDGVCKDVVTNEIVTQDGREISCACPESSCNAETNNFKICGYVDEDALDRGFPGVCDNCESAPANCGWCYSDSDCQPKNGVAGKCDYTLGLCQKADDSYNTQKNCSVEYVCPLEEGGSCAVEKCLIDGATCPSDGKCLDGAKCDPLPKCSNAGGSDYCYAQPADNQCGNNEKCILPANSDEVLSAMGREDPTGQSCEIGFFGCDIDLFDLFFSTGASVMEMFVGAVTLPIAILTAVLNFAIQKITSCRPQGCSGQGANCGGAGNCITYLHYFLYKTTIMSNDEWNWLDDVLSVIPDSTLENMSGSVEGSSDGSNSNVISSLLSSLNIFSGSSGAQIEDLLEGLTEQIGIGGVLGLFTLFKLNLNDTYCSGSDNACQTGPDEGRSCCPFYAPTCGESTSIIGRCSDGPNKDLSCKPAQEGGDRGDECPTGSVCKVRSNNETYRSVDAYHWAEPSSICLNPATPGTDNKRLNIFKCVGGASNGEICAGPENCPDGSCIQQNDSYCAVAPEVSSIKINNQNLGDVKIYGGDYVKMVFTTDIDSQQLPLNGYIVDWGDGKKDAVSGQALRSHPDKTNPFDVSHLYSFWDLQQAARDGVLKCVGHPITAGGTDCCNEQECHVVPKIQIRDNWNWCNGNLRCGGVLEGTPCNDDNTCGSSQCLPVDNQWGYKGNTCDTNSNAWQYYNGVITVYPYYSKF